MTIETSTEINLKKASTLIALVITIAGFGGGWVGVKAGYATLRRDLDKHEVDKDVHMSYQKKVEQFVSREEFALIQADARERAINQQQIKVTLARIEEQLKVLSARMQ